MAKYVKVKKVWKMLHCLGGCGAKPDTWADGWDKAIDTAIEELDKLPAADVQEVKHGHWIAEIRGLYHGINLLDDKNFKGLSMYSCSKCGEKVIFKGNYCPNCGAKMDGKD